MADFHEHAAPSFLFSTTGSNNLALAGSIFPKWMPLRLLENITNGFSEDRELGRGAYGTVYKGVYKSGETIAVKLLHSNPGFGDARFEKEFRNAISLYHGNIVRLIGFCHETRREFVLHNAKLIIADSIRVALCFEYMPKGSLDNYLSDECSGYDWPACYAIIKGICGGLKYLHEELEPPLYHLDLKPANILLDDNMMPKLSDFGSSMFYGREQTHTTGSCMGTFGYLPPEYIERNIISNKFDIFSLGVIIIKLIAGPTGYIQCAEIPSEQFIELVHEKWRKRSQATLEDRMEQYSEQLMRCIGMALSCVEKEWHKRPRIGDIIDKLNEMETKDQGCSDWVVSVEMCSTPAQASELAASSCTAQETTATKGVGRPSREHSRPTMVYLVTGLQLLQEVQSMLEGDWRDNYHIVAGEGVTSKVVVWTWNTALSSFVVSRQKQASGAAFLRELGDGCRRRAASPNGRPRTGKEMPSSTRRRRSPARLHAWRCQQPR